MVVVAELHRLVVLVLGGVGVGVVALLALVGLGARVDVEAKVAPPVVDAAGEEAAELAVIERLTPLLEAGKPARMAQLGEDEAELVAHLNLLTMKPVIYAANVAEDELLDRAAANP